MASGSAAIVQKLWNYCNILRDDGLLHMYGCFWLKDNSLEDSASLRNRTSLPRKLWRTFKQRSMGLRRLPPT